MPSFQFPIIDELTDKFLSSLKQPRPHLTALSCATGSGKSLEIPNKILDANAKAPFLTAARVFVSVPIVLAAKSLCNVQKKIQVERKTGRSIAFAAAGDNQYDDRTSIVYATIGHLILKILYRLANLQKQHKAKWVQHAVLDFTGVLVLDEIHCPCKENYLLLRLVKYLVQHQPTLVPPVVVCSATADVEDLNVLFPDLLTLVDGTTRPHPIHIQYHDRDYEIGRSEENGRDEKALFVDTMHKVVSIVKREFTVTYTKHEDDGDILVFLGGSQQIDEALDHLYGRVPATCVLLRAHAQLDDDELDRIMKTHQELSDEDETKVPYTRKIVLATNIAESSITLPGARFVVDAMTEKILHPMTETKYMYGRTVEVETDKTVLKLSKISKSSSKQRQGRVGRMSAGYYYPMCTERTWLKLPDFAVNEFERCPMDRTLLEFIHLDLDAMEILRLPRLRYNTTLCRMRAQKILDSKNQITPMGAYCAKLPIDLEVARWIYLADAKKAGTCKTTGPGAKRFAVSKYKKESVYDCLAQDKQETKEEDETEGACSASTEILDLVLVLAGIFQGIESSSVFYVPKQACGETISAYNARIIDHKQRYFHRFRKDCDFASLLYIFGCMYAETTGHGKRGGEGKDVFRQWGRDNSLNNKTLYSIRVRVYQLLKLFGKEHKLTQLACRLEESLDTPDMQALLTDAKKLFVRANPQKVFRRSMHSRFTCFLDKDGQMFNVNNRSSLNNIDLDTTKAVVGYSTIHIMSKKGKPFGLINYIFEVSLYQLVALEQDSEEEEEREEEELSSESDWDSRMDSEEDI